MGGKARRKEGSRVKESRGARKEADGERELMWEGRNERKREERGREKGQLWKEGKGERKETEGAEVQVRR